MFEGNLDQDSIVYNSLTNPTVTQFVRLNPKTWNENIALRVEFYGCDAGMITSYHCSLMFKYSTRNGFVLHFFSHYIHYIYI